MKLLVLPFLFSLASNSYGFLLPINAGTREYSIFSSLDDAEDSPFAKDNLSNGVASSDISKRSKASAGLLIDGSLKRREVLAASAAVLLGPMAMEHTLNSMPPTVSEEFLVALEEGDSVVRTLWLGRLAYPTLVLALEIGLFEALRENRLSKDHLGHSLDPPLSGTGHAMEALTSVLSSLGLLHIGNDERVELTEPAKMVLLKDSPYYWGHQLLAADGLMASLRRAVKLESLNHQTTKTPFQAHSNAATTSFIQSMQAHSATTADLTAVALEDILGSSSAYPATHVLDMAGGSGCFSRALTKRYQHLRVTLSDLPPVIELWRRENVGFSKRTNIDSTPADLFDERSWPRGADVILLANVIHDWSQEQCIQIAQAACSVLRQRTNPSSTKGRLILVEQLLHDDLSGPLPAALASVSMLLGDWRTGKQYSFSELQRMLLDSGFDNVELGPKCGAFHHAVIASIRD